MNTQCAQLTPPGRGAIATLLVTGEQATEAVEKFFQAASGKPLSSLPVGRIAFGLWKSAPEQTGEELVVCRRDNNEVEIHCHGGRAAIETIRQSLLTAGCRATTWQTIAQSQHADSIASAARIALAAAPTQRTAGILLDQMNGALGNALLKISNSLAAGDVDPVQNELARLLDRAKLGQHLTSPFQVVLAGLPNVGKSSLINAMLGHTRAIVFDQPGTTRDVLTGVTAFDGWPVELSDTAGIRETTDEIEAQGVSAARKRLQNSDVVVLVGDASLPPSREEQKLLEEFPAGLVVENKCDLPTPRPATDRLPLSAVSGFGIPELIQQITARLVACAPLSGEAVPFTAAQVEALETAFGRLDAGDLDRAKDVIDRILR